MQDQARLVRVLDEVVIDEQLPAHVDRNHVGWGLEVRDRHRVGAAHVDGEGGPCLGQHNAVVEPLSLVLGPWLLGVFALGRAREASQHDVLPQRQHIARGHLLAVQPDDVEAALAEELERIGWRDPAEAEDALQETFLTMVEKISAFKGQSQIYTWLYRIATNVALMKMRSKKGRTDLSIDEHEITEKVHRGEYASLPDNPEEVLGKSELKEYLDRAVSNLPPQYRSVFILRDIEQQSTRETSEILDITEDNVKTRLRRARMMLRDELKEVF